MWRHPPRGSDATSLRLVRGLDPPILCGACGKRRGLGQPHPLLPSVRMKTNIPLDARRCDDLARQLAVDSIRASTQAGSGHPNSSLSAAHLLAVLYSNHLRFDVSNPKHPSNDRFVLSKGHASPLMYAVFNAIGAIGDAGLVGAAAWRTATSGERGSMFAIPCLSAGPNAPGREIV
jgi:hypothetical protein